MMQRQDWDSEGNRQPKKSILEKLFPTVYALWRGVRKPRPAQIERTSLTPSQRSPIHPDTVAEAAQQGFPPAQAQTAQTAPTLPQGSPSPEPLPDLPQPPLPYVTSSPIAQTPPTSPHEPSIPSVSQLETYEERQNSEEELDVAPDQNQETTTKAGEELKESQLVRSEAVIIRARAQRILEEAETIHEEVEEVMAQAHYTFTKAMALNPDALKPMADTVRTLQETITTERQLRRLTRQQAEEEADWARQKAGDAILNSLSAIRKASNYVSRELEESKRIAATARSLKESSQSDLKRAQAIMAQADSLMRHEARRLLEEPRSAQTVPPRRRAPIPQPREEEVSYRIEEREPASAPPPEVQPEELVPLGGDAPGREQAPQVARAEAPHRPPLVEAEPNGEGLEEIPPDERESPDLVPIGQTEAAMDEVLRPTERPNVPAPRNEAPDPEPIPSGTSPLDDLDSVRTMLREKLMEFKSRRPPEQVGPSEELRRSQHPRVPVEPPARSDTELSPAQTESPSLENPDRLGQESAEFHSQGPPAQEKLSPANLELPQRPLESIEPAPAETEGEFGRDLLAQLQESLRNIVPAEESPEIAAAASVLEPQAPRPLVESQRDPGLVQPDVPSPTPAPAQSLLTPAPAQSLPTPAPAQSLPTPAPAQSQPLEGTYSGILYLVFTPAHDASTLSFLWDVVDTVAGGGW